MDKRQLLADAYQGLLTVNQLREALGLSMDATTADITQALHGLKMEVDRTMPAPVMNQGTVDELPLPVWDFGGERYLPPQAVSNQGVDELPLPSMAPVGGQPLCAPQPPLAPVLNGLYGPVANAVNAPIDEELPLPCGGW